RVAVGHVAGGDGDLRAERGKFRGQLGGAIRVGAAAAGEQEIACAVRGDQVPGEQGAERARPAGDQHGAVQVELYVLCRRCTAAGSSPDDVTRTMTQSGTSSGTSSRLANSRASPPVAPGISVHSRR